MTTKSIWNEFSDRLERFIHSRVNNTDDANDILQDVFIHIHLKKVQLKTIGLLKKYE